MNLIGVYSDGEIVKIKDKETQSEMSFDKSIRRDKISDKSRNELYNHIKNNDLQKYAQKTFEILTGKTVQEFEGENNG